MPNRAEILKQNFQNSIALPFEEILPEAVIQKILEEQGIHYRQTLYTPIVVLWSWLSQVIDADKSLSNAVNRIIAWLATAGKELPSADTGAYSKARKRLPWDVLNCLFRTISDGLQAEVKPEHQWCGRPIKAFDGTSILMSDTLENQKSYPQHSNQKEGCGLPIAKLVVWFCVITGAVIEVSLAAFNTSEWQLSRELYSTLRVEDVVVADSAYGGYVDLALVKENGADGVFRKHHARQCDFAKGKRLGVHDYIVKWQCPKKCPKTMTREEFEALPTSLEVRVVQWSMQQAGFRPKTIILVTTLLDPKRYPQSKLIELYQMRWQAAEVNLRHIKTTLKMEMIAAKTPEIVQKEVWVHLLAYNLLRALMWQSAKQSQVEPLRLSLQGTRQQFNHFRTTFAQVSAQNRRHLYSKLLEVITDHLVPLRPYRVEPRVVKRRPKPFPRMQEPRSVLKAKLVN
jgi:hypothetical protein